MARLLIKTAGLENRILELRLGVNRVGRDPDCEFCVEHPTISSLHCELALTNDGVYLRDCRSTNGTFINGKPVMEAWLDPGQTVHLATWSCSSKPPTPMSRSRSLSARARSRRWFCPTAR